MEQLSGECPACGSVSVETCEREYGTGVTLDGYEERWRVIGVRCRECGGFEELERA